MSFNIFIFFFNYDKMSTMKYLAHQLSSSFAQEGLNNNLSAWKYPNCQVRESFYCMLSQSVFK